LECGSSDYGTMSNQVAEEQNLDDLIPGLNLTDSSGCIFNDIAVHQRQERIDSIVREIMAVPCLSEAVLTHRSSVNQDKLRKYLSNENLSTRTSAMSGRTSNLRKPSSRSKAPTLHRSISSPKLSNVPETSSRKLEGRNLSRASGVALKGSMVPNLNLAGLRNQGTKLNTKSTKMTKPPSAAQQNKDVRLKPRLQAEAARGRQQGRQVQDLDAERREETKGLRGELRVADQAIDLESNVDRSQNLAMERFLPNLGDDTQNELVFMPPTFGDDTTQTMSSSSIENSSDCAGAPSKQNARTNFVSENKMAASEITRKISARARLDPVSVKPSHKSGSVPKYLKARQQQWKNDAQAVIDNTPDPDCPPGHIRLNEEDRITQLGEMNSTHKDLLMDLNKLPVSSDTRRVTEKRAQIEDLLLKLEAGIRVYSRPKVFVKPSEE